MKIISWNVNGVRAAHKKGLMDYIAAADADVFCIQETKAHLEQLSKEIYAPEGYQSWWQSAERRGYSGTAIWAKREPDSLEPLGVEEFDNEGRMQVAIFGDMAILNGYFPNSQAEGARLTYKLGFNAAVKQRADALAAEGKTVIVTGDFNVSHKTHRSGPAEGKRGKSRLSSRREGLDGLLHRRRLDRHIPNVRRGSRKLHMVVLSGWSPVQECGMEIGLLLRQRCVNSKGPFVGDTP
jgi:exodeoxyribonuclease-3